MIKLFLKNIIVFLIPIILMGIYIEVYLGNYPSAFQQKADYINSNKNTVEVLILGSSHNQTSINPELLTNKNTANFAFSGQDYQLDYLLLDKYIGQLPRLKTVIFEMGYHSLETENRPLYERNSLYLRFCGINNFRRRVNPIDYSIFLSDPKHYLEFLNPFQEKTIVNKYGFAVELSNSEENGQRFKNLNFDAEKISLDSNNVFISRHKFENPKVYEKNKVIFEKMIRLCAEHHIKPIILIPPVYITYYKEMIPAKKRRRDTFAEYICKKYPNTSLYNFEDYENSIVTHFMDEDHLNMTGATKFTKMIDSLCFQQKEDNL